VVPTGGLHALLQLQEAVAQSCTPFRKLRMLLELLDAPMKRIVELWAAGEMQVWQSRDLQGVANT
jgi:hypothetical protein